MGTDPQGWRDHLGTEVEPLPGSGSLRCGISRFGSTEGSTAGQGTIDAVLIRWDFSHQGGSFGSMETTSFIAATHVARTRRLPLVTVMRSGGTKLPEGMRALVGIPRAAIALEAVRGAGLAHVSIADNPTTGGVWVSIGSRADLRIAMADAFIGFSGPRVVEAMTGRALAAGAGSAQASYDAGLVDAIATPETINDQLAEVLAILASDQPQSVGGIGDVPPPELAGDDQVEAADSADRPTGQDLLDRILDQQFPIKGADDEVSAAIGRVAGRRVIAVALGADRASMPGPAGFGLLERCAALAGTLQIGLLCLVDTPGADPHTEAAGLSSAIAGSLLAVLSTPAPTISLVHGAGGSGGALAGAVTDVVGVSRYGWFAALGPSGAAAALRIDRAEASRLMRVTPADLLSDGLADTYVTPGTEAAWVAGELDRLGGQDPAERLAQRTLRWSSPLG